MKPLLTVLFLVLTAPMSWAKDYLDSPAMFDAAWGKLAAALPEDTQALEVSVFPESIRLTTLSPGGEVLGWKVARVRMIVMLDLLSGPEPTRPAGKITTPEAAAFALSEVPMARFHEVLAGARESVTFAAPPRVRHVNIARKLQFGAQLSMGDVRWGVELENGSERARVELAADGGLIGSDISDTRRGRELNFLAPEGWDMAEVEAGFAGIIGPETEVQDIAVSARRITYSITSPDDPKMIREISWDGGRFTRGLVDSSGSRLALIEGARPFRMADIGLAGIPAAVGAAREASGQEVVKSLNARFVPLVRGDGPVWIVRFASPAAPRDSDEDWVVRVAPGGQVLEVVRPESQRAVQSFVDGAGAVAGIGVFAAKFGENAQILEIDLRPDRLTVTGMDVGSPGMTLGITWDGDRMRNEMPFPVIGQTAADQFSLAEAARADPAALEAMKRDALERFGLQGGVAKRLSLWSGGPFYSAPDGRPMWKVWVEVPGQMMSGGFAVYSFDGGFVDLNR